MCRRHEGVVRESLKKLSQQVDIEVTDPRARVVDVVMQAGSPGEVQHHA